MVSVVVRSREMRCRQDEDTESEGEHVKLRLQLANLRTSGISLNSRLWGSAAGSPAPELAVTPKNLAEVEAFCSSPIAPQPTLMRGIKEN